MVAAGGPQAGYALPQRACESLTAQDALLVLHCISFSHYCERARWSLRLHGIPFKEVGYLPLLHIPGIIALQRQFQQAPGPPTASSKSPAATPCLAIYKASGEPWCLLQDSALICRYAALRAAALQPASSPPAVQLYGPTLSLADAVTSPAEAPPAHAAPPTDTTGVPPPAGPAAAGADSAAAGGAGGAGSSGGGAGGARAVVGGDAAVEELELRLAGAMGVENRRLSYFHLLPTSAGSQLFVRNHPGSPLVAYAAYGLGRLLLPSLLGVNAASTARGREALLREFDFFDDLLLQQQQQQQGRQQGGSAHGLPYYLTGPSVTAADVSLACLAAPLLCVPRELKAGWAPPLDLLPEELRSFVEELQKRPTGKFVLDMWRQHGPCAGAV